MNDFTKLVRERRSANKFLEGITIPKEDFMEIFEELSLAPSAFNLQHANYHVVQDKEVMQKIYEAAFKQYKILTASATIIVTGNKKAYQDAERIYEGSKMLGVLDENEFKQMIDMITNLYEGWGEPFQQDEAVRNGSLSAMLFMLLAKNKDWDTCPMIYFDKDKVKSILNLPENEEPILMITMGKMDEKSFRVRGYRKPVFEFVKFY